MYLRAALGVSFSFLGFSICIHELMQEGEVPFVFCFVFVQLCIYVLVEVVITKTLFLLSFQVKICIQGAMGFGVYPLVRK